jgi:tetratricopeptide (TPR) repeat protein
MGISARELWEMYTTSGKSFLRLHNYADAARMFAAALQVAEGFGPKDPHLGVSLNNLAHAHQLARLYAEAEALYRRAIELTAQEHGPDHPDAAVCLANLAGLYQAQQRYVEAEPLYRKAVEILGKTLGEEHASMATLLENYASNLWSLAHDAEAAKAEEWARAIRRRRAPAAPSAPAWSPLEQLAREVQAIKAEPPAAAQDLEG